ncbi:aldehyde dehydrogenase family protein [Arthrobacter sp.]|uniref:aldehyde dehydrogenase family protein n=1 Tax=Arthrobacter sp. TaxID=1667 RepID=UPI0028124164|nr:aldehyde dehydrogenase family protein [Arthrobacter sp.]
MPGHSIEPTVVSGLNDTARLVAEEQFGPVLPIVSYTHLDAVIETLNCQEYGLGASVWSADPEAAESVAGRPQVGSWSRR